MEYIAFIHKEGESYVAVVPDLNYTSSFGDTFSETVHNIVEASELYCEDLETLPEAHSLEDIRNNKSIDIETNATPHLVILKG